MNNQIPLFNGLLADLQNIVNQQSSTRCLSFILLKEQYVDCFIQRHYLGSGSLDPIALSILKYIHEYKKVLTLPDLYKLIGATSKDTQRVISEIVYTLFSANKLNYNSKTDQIISYRNILDQFNIRQIIKEDNSMFAPRSRYLSLKPNKVFHKVNNKTLNWLEQELGTEFFDLNECDNEYYLENNLKKLVADFCELHLKKPFYNTIGYSDFSRIETLQRSRLLSVEDRLLYPKITKIKPIQRWRIARCLIFHGNNYDPKSVHIKVYRYKKGPIVNTFTNHLNNLIKKKPEVGEKLIKSSVRIN